MRGGGSSMHLGVGSAELAQDALTHVRTRLLVLAPAPAGSVSRSSSSRRAIRISSASVARDVHGSPTAALGTRDRVRATVPPVLTCPRPGAGRVQQVVRRIEADVHRVGREPGGAPFPPGYRGRPEELLAHARRSQPQESRSTPWPMLRSAPARNTTGALTMVGSVEPPVERQGEDRADDRLDPVPRTAVGARACSRATRNRRE